MGVPLPRARPPCAQREAEGKAKSAGHAQPRLTVLAAAAGREGRIPGGSAAQGVYEVSGDVGLSHWQGARVWGTDSGLSLSVR